MKYPYLLLICSPIVIASFLFTGSKMPVSNDALQIEDTSAKNILIADPFVLKEGKTYYLYGTSGINANAGIPVYSSEDLIHWKSPVASVKEHLALKKGESYGEKGFWAPFVLKRDKKYYMYYTANEHVAVAVSDSPLGPFIQSSFKPLHEEIKEIDPHVFIDDNNKKYIYVVRLQEGNRIFGAQLNDDLVSINEKSLTPCISYSQEWEIASGTQWPVTEAPAMLKHKGKYYLFYTANDFRHPNYNVGYAVSDSPLGPWKKSESNPIIPKTENIQGTGHCEFTKSPTNELIMFYHTHQSMQKVSPRKTVYSKMSFRSNGKGIDTPLVDTSKKFSYTTE